MKPGGVSTYPTGRAAWLAAAAAGAAALLGALAPGRWRLAFLFGLFVLAVALLDYALSASPRRLSVRARTLANLQQGEEADLAVETDFEGRPTPRGAEAAVSFGERLAVAPRVQAVQDGVARFRLRALRRGPGALTQVQVRWPGPLGLMRRQRDLPLDRDVLVTPDLAAARAAARSLGDDALGGPKLDLRRGAGGEFRALRAYQTGDERRLIDWKRSAARGALLVKEFQLEQNHPVVLALDCGRQMIEPVEGRPRLDQAISAALALAYAGLSVGDRVRLYGFDEGVRAATSFLSGRASFASMQAAAARLDCSVEASNYTLALHRIASDLDRRALIVVFTEFTDTVAAELMLESVGRLVRRHAVMFVVFRDAELDGLITKAPEEPRDVSSAVVAASLLRERQLVLERLKRLGVRAVETTPAHMGGAVVDAYLDLKRREAL